MEIIAFDHILLAMPVGGEEKARQFYGGVLNLPEVPKPEPLASRGGCWFDGPGMGIHLGAQSDFTPPKKAHPAFRVVDLEAARQALEAANISVMPDDAVPHVRRFFVQDPFGNLIEFIQDGDVFV